MSSGIVLDFASARRNWIFGGGKSQNSGGDGRAATLKSQTFISYSSDNRWICTPTGGVCVKAPCWKSSGSVLKQREVGWSLIAFDFRKYLNSANCDVIANRVELVPARRAHTEVVHRAPVMDRRAAFVSNYSNQQLFQCVPVSNEQGMCIWTNCIP